MNETNKEVAIMGAPATKKNPRRYWILVCAAVLASGLVVEKSAAGHREHEDRDIWFVHATDPHLFVPDAQKTEKESSRKKQQKLNEQALSDMLDRIRWLPEAHGAPAFLVLTGDLGIDPCDISKAGSKPGTSAECVEAHNSDIRTTQIKETADALSKSPVPDIYLVAGNNDIAKESVEDAALKYFNKFIDDLQAALDKKASGVRLHNLTRCYATGEASTACSADIPNTPYRLIGLPSYSFKNDLTNFPDEAARTRQKEAQVKQLERFREMVKEAQKAHRKVLVVSHTPEMDDPYQLGQERYGNATATATATPTATPSPTATPTPAATATPTAPATATTAATPALASTPTATPAKAAPSPKEGTDPKSTPSVATWNMHKEALDSWKGAVASDSVVAVLAGHLHDSHKEIYRQPYAWSSINEHRLGFHKLFLAPPLAVKKQDTSPIQARGFSLVHLRPGRVESSPFWYNSETREFTPDSKHKHHLRKGGFWRSFCQGPRTVITWLWNLDKADDAMVRMAVLLIAFLTAFLTIVAIWQFPLSSDQFEDDKKSAAGEPKTTQGASNASTDSSPFANRFGKTVIAGLSGLAVTEIAKALGNQPPSADTRWYYIVWFILFFFFLLVLLNLWRALVEASRARVAVIHHPFGLPGSVGAWERFTHWLSSLRVPLLTFSDTFINLIQGKNQTRTKVFEDKIIDQQQNVIRVADAIRTSLSNLIEARVRQGRQNAKAKAEAEAEAAAEKQRKAELAAGPPAAVPPAPVAPAPVAPAAVAPAAVAAAPAAPAPVAPAVVAPAADAPAPDELNLVRVNISVLSRDQTSVFYVSRAPGSSHAQFPKKSVAWVSVFTGQIRWYQSSYRDQPNYEEIVLFDNHTRNDTRVIPGDDDSLMLKDYYRFRTDEDYQAFVIFPVPSPRREFGSDYVKGAIHISFRLNSDLDSVWNATAMTPVAEPGAETPPTYLTPQRTLQDWCRDPGVRAALSNSIAILGELLRGFNEIIYKNYIESR